MARPGSPKHRVSRRFGFDVYGTGGASLQRRIATPPGGQRGRRQRRPSTFSQQLAEKQKVKAIYGLREKQFRHQFEAAQRQAGAPGANLLARLERRLDNIVYRLGFARSRPMARQLVGHGHVRVDGQRVDIPSALVEPGSVVTLTDEAARMPIVIEEMGAGRPVASWLERGEGATGRVVRLPGREDVEYPIDEALVVGFYAR